MSKFNVRLNSAKREFPRLAIIAYDSPSSGCVFSSLDWEDEVEFLNGYYVREVLEFEDRSEVDALFQAHDWAGLEDWEKANDLFAQEVENV